VAEYLRARAEKFVQCKVKIELSMRIGMNTKSELRTLEMRLTKEITTSQKVGRSAKAKETSEILSLCQIFVTK
jgi:hypothetical protein